MGSTLAPCICPMPRGPPNSFSLSSLAPLLIGPASYASNIIVDYWIPTYLLVLDFYPELDLCILTAYLMISIQMFKSPLKYNILKSEHPIFPHSSCPPQPQTFLSWSIMPHTLESSVTLLSVSHPIWNLPVDSVGSSFKTYWNPKCLHLHCHLFQDHSHNFPCFSWGILNHGTTEMFWE